MDRHCHSLYFTGEETEAQVRWPACSLSCFRWDRALPRPSSATAGETGALETPVSSVGQQREGRIAEVGVTPDTETKEWRRKKAFFPSWDRTREEIFQREF